MPSGNPSLAAGTGVAKIRPDHLQRLACIYIRQSSLKQVEQHRESQRNQYQLVQRAQALGWRPDRIHVIDADQGLSGAGSAYRPGFQELAAEVSLNHVGIIFGYEVSRLARNNSDWYHLLDLAALFATLIADNDGLYDPRLYNDRLLLGLKGTMSEAELHLLQQRMAAGRLSQVKRGAYRQGLPIGLARLSDGTVIKDPDDQIRHLLELVFAQFEALGSGRQVLRYLWQKDILLPRRQPRGPHQGEVLWKPATEAAVYEILRNPAYAGAFAYGRHQTDPTQKQPGRPGTGLVHRPMEEWIHLQQQVYPAYITWDQYLANQHRLHQNATTFAAPSLAAQGIARDGAGVLQGLATCGKCSHPMRVFYKRDHTPRYACYALARTSGEASCMSLHGPSIDQRVIQAFFEALQPAQLDALEAVLEKHHVERQRLVQHWEERLQRAQYAARLGQRQYQAVDPENRLVAAELERRWEETLRHLQETQEAYHRFQQTPTPSGLTPQLRHQLQHLSESLPLLWPTLSPSHQKELLRSLIARVILNRVAADRIEIRIVWQSGHYSVTYAQPPILRQGAMGRYAEMLQQIHTLWHQGRNDQQIATQLTAEGFHSPRAAEVLPTTVATIRRQQGWHLMLQQSRKALGVQGHLTVRGLAARLGVEQTWVYRRIYNGTIASNYVQRHPQAQIYMIKEDPQLIAQLRQLLPATLHT